MDDRRKVIRRTVMDKYQEIKELLKKAMRENKPFVRLYCRNVLNIVNQIVKEENLLEATDEVAIRALNKQIKSLAKAYKKVGDCALGNEYVAEMRFCKMLLGVE